MSELDYEQELIKQRMWNNYPKNDGDLCTVCTKCCGGYISICWCARERFVNKITDKDMYKHLKNNIEDKIKTIKSELEIKENEIQQLEEKFSYLTS